MTSNMIYIAAHGVGFKCPRKIHLNTPWGGEGGTCAPKSSYGPAILILNIVNPEPICLKLQIKRSHNARRSLLTQIFENSFIMLYVKDLLQGPRQQGAEEALATRNLGGEKREQSEIDTINISPPVVVLASLRAQR